MESSINPSQQSKDSGTAATLNNEPENKIHVEETTRIAAASTCSAGEPNKKRKISHVGKIPLNYESQRTIETNTKGKKDGVETASSPTNISPSDTRNLDIRPAPADKNEAPSKSKLVDANNDSSIKIRKSENLDMSPSHQTQHTKHEKEEMIQRKGNLEKDVISSDTHDNEIVVLDISESQKKEKKSSGNSKERIHALLSHRRLLLERLSLCRTHSIEHTQSEAKESINEVEEFRKITRQALQTIKRPSMNEKNPFILQTRGAISLRKGASVGKKMAAAVSTLNNSGGWISDSSSSTSPTPLVPSVHSNGSNSATNTDSVLITGNCVPSSNSFISQGNLSSSGTRTNNFSSTSEPKLLNENIVQKTSGAFHEKLEKESRKGLMTLKSTPSSLHAPKINDSTITKMKRTSSLNQVVSSTGLVQPVQKIKRNNSFKDIHNVQSLGNSSADNIISANIPLHMIHDEEESCFTKPMKNHQPVLSDSEKLENEQFKIYFCEVNKLLRKRKSLQGDLIKRYNKRRAKDLINPELFQSQKQNKIKDTYKLSSSLPSQGPKHISVNRLPYQIEHLQPKPLPCRRKTHWDYVLEEMRWLATDFIEERKWKEAAGRTISAAAHNHFCETGTSPIRSPLKSKCRQIYSDEEGKRSNDGSNQNNISLTIGENTEELVQNKLTKTQDTSINNLTYKGCDSKIFTDPTEADMDSARSISKLLNLMVSSHWESIIRTDGLQASSSELAKDLLLSRSFHRFQKVKQKLNMTTSNNSKILFDLEEARVVSSDDELSRKNKSTVLENPKSFLHENLTNQSEVNTNASKCQELSHEEISKCIEKLDTQTASIVQELDSMENGEFSDQDKNQYIDCRISPNLSQRKAIKFVEKVWECSRNISNSKLGAVITGPFGCGKTISVVTLLWKRRLEGPQLILCPSASVIRWRYELRRMVGLHILTFGRHGWAFDDESIYTSHVIHNKCHVVICEFSAFEKLCKHYFNGWERYIRAERNTGKDFMSVPFTTTVLDGRKLSAPSIATFKHHLSQERINQKNISLFVPHELLNPSWWNNLMFFLTLSKSNRLLIETTGLLESKTSQHAYENLGIHDQQRNEILAMKLAFLHHQLFFADNISYTAKATQWARKSKLDVSKDNAIDSLDCFLMRPILSQTFVQNRICRSRYHGEMTYPEAQWNIKLCKLPYIQEKVYNESCFHLRGFLSSLDKYEFNLENFIPKNSKATDLRPFFRSTKSLMKLRRLCICSNLQNLLLSGTPRKGINSDDQFVSKMEAKASFNLFCGCSTQPDIDFANKVFQNSAKLRELWFILMNDCGYICPFTFSSVTSELTLEPGKRQEKDLKRKKVLILATLPEVLLLVSKFLNSVGITHLLLSNTSAFSCSQQLIETFDYNKCLHNSVKTSHQSPSTTNDRSRVQYSLTWSRSQQALSRLTSGYSNVLNESLETENLDVDESYYITVASPAAIGSASGGLCASNADVVVCLDEDWSGRGDSQLLSIVFKNLLMKNEALKSSFPVFIKLISQGTCEETFFATDPETNKSKQLSKCNTIPFSIHNCGHFQHDFDENLAKEESDESNSRSLESTDNYQRKIPDSLRLGYKIYQFHDWRLDSVLQNNEELPYELSNGTSLLFLPTCKLIEITDSITSDKKSSHQTVQKREKFIGNFAALFGVALAQSERFSSWIDCNLSKYYNLRGKQTLSHNIQNFTHPFRSSIFFPSLPNEFPKMESSRRDISSKPIQLFIERMKPLVLSASSFRIQFVDSKIEAQPHSSSVSNETISNEKVVNADEVSDVDFAASWYFRGFSNRPEILASSFLYYSESMKENNLNSKPTQNSRMKISNNVEEKKSNDFEQNTPSASQKQGANRYAEIFSSLDLNCGSSLQDGNQGRESFVYFPPLFPGLLSTYHYTSLGSNEWVNLMSNKSQNKKRKKSNIVIDCTEQNKRLCPSQPIEELKSNVTTVSTDTSLLNLDFDNMTGSTSHITDEDLADALLTPHDDVEALCADLPNMESNDVLFSSSLLDTDTSSSKNKNPGDPLSLESSLNIDMKEPMHQIGTDDACSEPEQEIIDFDNVKHSAYGDFGLIGNGIIPTKQESFRIASRCTVRVNSHPYWCDSLELSSFGKLSRKNSEYTDSEDYNNIVIGGIQGYSLDSIIILVKYKSPNHHVNSTNLVVHSPTAFYAGDTSKHSTNTISHPDFLNSLNPTSQQKPKFFIPDAKISELNTTGHLKSAVTKFGKNQDSRYGTFNYNATLKTGLDSFPRKGNAYLSSSESFNLYESNGNSSIKGWLTGEVFRNGLHDASFIKASVHLRNCLQFQIYQDKSTHSSSADNSNQLPVAIKDEDDKLLKPKQNWMMGATMTSSLKPKVLESTCKSLFLSNDSKLHIDFGPFQIGKFNFVDSSLDNASPETKSGISLPMGVKVPNARKEKSSVNDQLEVWSKYEDEKLQTLSTQYSLNWNAVSRALSYSICSCHGKQTLRSARQCEGRWKSLRSRKVKFSDIVPHEESTVSTSFSYRNVSFEEKMLKTLENKKSIKQLDTARDFLIAPVFSHRESDSSQVSRLRNHEISDSVLLDPCMFLNSKEERHQSKDTSSSEKLNASVASKSLSERLIISTKSSLKRQNIPLTIPGCAAGNIVSSLPLAPPHPSHSQSVQKATSVSNMSNGSVPSRSEMWPLQLLDSLDKQASKSENNVSSLKQQEPASPAKGRPQPANVSVSQPQHQSQNTYHQIHPPNNSAPSVQRPQNNINSAPTTSRPPNQQELVKQAARAAALGVPTNRARIPIPSGETTMRKSSSEMPIMQMRQQRPAPIQQSPVPVASVPLPTHIHPSRPLSSAGLSQLPNPLPLNMKPATHGSSYVQPTNARNHSTAQQNTGPAPAYNLPKGVNYVNNPTHPRR